MTTDRQFGFKVGVTSQRNEAEPLKFEKVLKMPSKQLRISESEFFGHNCFRLSCERKYLEKL